MACDTQIIPDHPTFLKLKINNFRVLYLTLEVNQDAWINQVTFG